MPAGGRSALQVWEAVYARDRRAHRHRCRCCHKIIQPGEQVLMFRQDNLTRALHAVCAGKPCGGPESEFSWRDTAVIIAMERLLRFPSTSSRQVVAAWVMRQVAASPVAARCDLSPARLVRYGASEEFAFAQGATLDQVREARRVAARGSHQ